MQPVRFWNLLKKTAQTKSFPNRFYKCCFIAPWNSLFSTASRRRFPDGSRNFFLFPLLKKWFQGCKGRFLCRTHGTNAVFSSLSVSIPKTKPLDKDYKIFKLIKNIMYFPVIPERMDFNRGLKVTFKKHGLNLSCFIWLEQNWQSFIVKGKRAKAFCFALCFETRELSHLAFKESHFWTRATFGKDRMSDSGSGLKWWINGLIGHSGNSTMKKPEWGITVLLSWTIGQFGLETITLRAFEL